MHLEDGVAALEVRAIDRDLAVETTGTQERGVEDVRAVGRGDEDDPRGDVEPVHLDQHLVEGLLALVVTAAETGAAVTTDGIDLVDEDDGRGIGLCLLEEVAHTARADADEHLHEVGAGDREEGYARLACHRSREQCLAGAGRSVEEHALGDLGAHRLELRGFGEELLDLLQLFDGLIRSRHIGEGRLGHVLGDGLGLGLAEVHDASAALHLTHEEEEQQDDQCEGQQREEQTEEDVVLGDDDVVAARELTRCGLLLQQSLELHALTRDVLARDDRAVLESQLEDLVAVGDHGGLHAIGLDVGYRLARVDAVGPADATHESGSDKDQHDGKQDPEERPAEESLGVHLVGFP